MKVWFWISLVVATLAAVAGVVDRDCVWLAIAAINGYNAYNFRKIINE